MNTYATLYALRDADYHEGGIRCRRLFRVAAPFWGPLRGEVLDICRTRRASIVSRSEHVTHWTQPSGEVLQYSLLNASGRYDDATGDHNESCLGKQFRDSSCFPTVAAFIAQFPHCINFRINVLGRHSGLAPHEEHLTLRTRSGGVGLRTRFHLPVVTNTNCELTLDGCVYHLEEAIIYFVNHGCIHSAANHGDSPRVHLVWDMLLTRAAFDLMFGEANNIALPLERIPAGEQEIMFRRRERMSAPRRLRRAVSWREARQVDFCEVQ
jgi:hypothetical protein